MSVFAALQKEVRALRRDPGAIALSIVLPVLITGAFSTLHVADYYTTAVARQLTTLILTLAVMFPAFLWSSGLIVQERVRGTLSRLERTPLSSAEFVGSKFAAASLVSVLQATLVTILGTTLLAAELGTAPVPSLWAVLVALALATVALGLLASAAVSTPEQTASVVSIGTLVMVVLCGFVKPIEDLGAAGSFAQFLPFTQGFQAFSALLRGSSAWEQWLLELIVTALALLAATVAITLLRGRARIR